MTNLYFHFHFVTSKIYVNEYHCNKYSRMVNSYTIVYGGKWMRLVKAVMQRIKLFEASYTIEVQFYQGQILHHIRDTNSM